MYTYISNRNLEYLFYLEKKLMKKTKKLTKKIKPADITEFIITDLIIIFSIRKNFICEKMRFIHIFI